MDIHQHLWPPEFVDRLRARDELPYLRGWTLHVAGEPPYEVRAADHDVERRRGEELRRGDEQVILSPSSPLGVEDLPSGQPLLAAWHDGVRKLGPPYTGWAAVSREDPDLDVLADFAGLQVPATWLATPAALEACAPILAACEARGRPVFVHPGAVRERIDAPAWWPPVVDYVAQLQAAWWAWRVAGRALLPDLRICFAAGAGLAPVHHERFRARGGPPAPVDRNVFVETSSYGPQGVDALVRALGIDVVVHGSDYPYAEPADPHLGDAARHAMRVANPHRLLKGENR